MDLSTFYAVVAGTCFTLVGLWWNVVERRPDWLADPHLRRLVGGVYVSFLLPALMSLVAQIDPSEPLIWRITFVAASAMTAPQATAVLLVLLVVPAHALTWEFMTQARREATAAQPSRS